MTRDQEYLEEREADRAEGRAEGRAEKEAEDIKIIIKTLLELKQTEEAIIQILQNKFNLSLTQAIEYFKECS